MEPAGIFFRRDAISTAVHRINWSTRAEASQKMDKLPSGRKPKDGVIFAGKKNRKTKYSRPRSAPAQGVPDPRRTQPQQPSRTARIPGQQASRSHQTIKSFAIRQQTARIPDQPLVTSASIHSQSARVQASSRPVQLKVHSLVVRFQQSTKLKGNSKSKNI
ncbi:hypothetical protein F2Q70_00039078 [Brassica cretica]|uniref:Uncharacterized protein n=1 Tax=Brassica cretica TaxID=69181 RepID=A0A8S9MNM4_BRACR|nr:hypothetical protein F2Q70_00039078 [Brassica cretica]KAF2619086.1 hypothetical protein F2Q68_00039755 [Brassica cretica]